MQEQPFTVHVEAEAFYKADAIEGRRRRIGGFVSSSALDRQGEILIQEGLDFEPFLKSGWFNDNHLKQTGKAVGYPEVAELRAHPKGGQGWYVEGYLLEGHGPADEIWSLAESLERSGAPRRLGYSVEGAVTERDADDRRTVRKAVVREVAVTRCPVNTGTELVMLAKSLAAGHAVSDPGTSGGEGFALRTESLEGDEDEKKRKKRKIKLTKSVAIELLMSRNANINQEAAARIVEYAQRHFAA